MYRNGRQAKVGDTVVRLSEYEYRDGAQVIALGVLQKIVPGNDYNRGTITPLATDTEARLCDMLLVDDLAVILREKGLDR